MGEEMAVGIEELGAPLAIGGKDVVELGAGAQADDEFVEFFRGAEAAGILDGHLPEHEAALAFAEDFHHQIEVALHDVHVLFKIRVGR